MSKLIAVLDSCVLFPNMLIDTLLTAFDLVLYQAYWSQSILNGVTRNLVKREIINEKKAKYLENTIKSYFPEAMIEVSPNLVSQMTNNQEDRHILATAITVEAEIIVTFNLKHFQLKDTINWGVKAQHPDLFLLNLLRSDSTLMLRGINEQVARFRNPPLTTKKLLEILAKDVPEFVSELSKYEDCDTC